VIDVTACCLSYLPVHCDPLLHLLACLCLKVAGGTFVDRGVQSIEFDMLKHHISWKKLGS